MDPELDQEMIPELDPDLEPFLGFGPELVDPFFARDSEPGLNPGFTNFTIYYAIPLLCIFLAVICDLEWQETSARRRNPDETPTLYITRGVLLLLVHVGLMIKWEVEMFLEGGGAVYWVFDTVYWFFDMLIWWAEVLVLCLDVLLEEEDDEEDNEEDEEGFEGGIEDGGCWRLGGWRG